MAFMSGRGADLSVTLANHQHWVSKDLCTSLEFSSYVHRYIGICKGTSKPPDQDLIHFPVYFIN